MAGSLDLDLPTIPFDDPIIRARVEALEQLADGLSERVAVLDRELNVIYANKVAWSGSPQRDSAARPVKCYQAFINRQDPCGTCPAKTVFETQQVRTLSCSVHGDGTACGMRQAFPMMSGRGDVGSVLVLFDNQPLRRVSGRERTDAGSPGNHATPESFRLGELIGQSSPMQQVFHMIRLVADSSATVLIQGESGTGKELVAKTIHQLSYRRTKPFVVVDCGSLPETLLESELFGHMKGAFTGAASNKRGLFEEADGGTLFLDEIADTSPAFQAKLLRVLQEGELKRVGSSRPVKIDVRVISATNKDLSELAKGKLFRQDLYYRLAVLPLHLPALRDRKTDIPLLAAHFVAASCRKHRQPVRTITDDVMHVLTEAQWPGNVRELQHYIERAVITTDGPALSRPETPVRSSASTMNDLRSVGRGAARQAERVRIVQALSQSSGNRVRAAKLLKISRAGLYNKLRAYGLDGT
jgi:two-component system, NtrC family, response regulator HydG